MPITRSANDFNHTQEWTSSILEVPNQSGFIKSKGLFLPSYTDQDAILFDRIESTTTLLPSVNRRGGKPTYGKDRDVTTFSLPLAYFHHMDQVTKQDYNGKRRAGTADEQDTKANVIAEKLVDMRRAVDQTHEYMFLQALKGNCVTPDGVVLANMFTQFSVAQPTVDFLLGTQTTNVTAKIGELKDEVSKNLKTGGVISGPLDVIVDRSFFNKLVNHPNVIQNYMNSISNVQYQKDLSDYMTWGISDVFLHQGVRFMVYGHEFNMPDGSTEVAIASNTGHVAPRVQGDSIFRTIYGGSQRMDSEGGSEMFAWEYTDPRGRAHELEVETALVAFCTKPAALVKVTTSN